MIPLAPSHCVQWAYPLILIGNPPIYAVITSMDVAKNIGRWRQWHGFFWLR